MRISYLLFELGSRGITVVVEIIITVLINIRWYVANSLEDVDGTRIYIYIFRRTLFLDRFLTFVASCNGSLLRYSGNNVAAVK